jgi:hypothetical protein
VHAYLNRYAAVGGLPTADLSTVNQLHKHAQQLWLARQETAAATAATAASNTAEQAASSQRNAATAAADDAATEQLITAQLAFLDAAVGLARRRFTLFQQGPIWAGCAAGVVVLALQLIYCW